MMLAALLMAQVVSTTAGVPQTFSMPAGFPYTSNAGIDLGCLGGIAGSRYPAQIYDPVNHERISYNVSRCTGGYIHATNEQTQKSWDVQIAPGGRIYGKDTLGHKWNYDRKRSVYVNQASQATCAYANYRDMCASS